MIAHGLTDTLLTSALMIAEADEDAALGLVIAGIAARPIGSFAVELAHNGEYILAPIGSLMLPVMAAGGAVGVAEGIGVSDDKPAIVRALAGGLMVGGSVMAALEASFAFEDAEPLRVSAGPGGVTLAGAF